MAFLTPMVILLVEDNPGDIRLAQEMLKDSTARVDLKVVRDGVQAMKYLRKEEEYKDSPTPDLVLLDLNMPKKDGREVLIGIKNDPDLKRIPVIVLTVSSAEIDILRAYDAHANCYIVKPLDLERFRQVMQSIEIFWFSTATLPPK